MQKERVELFEEPRLLGSGKSGATLGDIGRAGRGFMRLTALGMSIFSLIFILCCFLVGFDMADNVHGSGSAQTTLPSQSGDVTAAPSGGADNAEGQHRDETSPDSSAPDSADRGSTPVVTLEQLYAFDASRVPSGETAIIPYDLSLPSLGKTYIYNNTSYAPDVATLLYHGKLPTLESLGAEANPSGAPVVLIVHTHGTEAYSPEGAVSYDGVSELARSSDITENVVSVGAVMAEILNSRGISTLHCTVMHDKQSYRDSYSRSAETVKKYLEQYPTIKYVIDVHRDSVTNKDGALLRPVTVADGKAAAQVMCVVGSDEGGADYPNWQDNLSFALKLRDALNSRYSGISRPVCLRPSAYNQQYAPVSILLEVGASGNYLSEAQESARLCAEVLADIIKK